MYGYELWLKIKDKEYYSEIRCIAPLPENIEGI